MKSPAHCHYSLVTVLLSSLIYGAASVSAAQTDYPSNAGLVNVKTAYGATGDGVTDDTPAIQQAIKDNIGKLRVLYFPSGTYLVSDTLIWKNASGTWMCYLNLQGQDRDSTIIRLQDNCPGFGSAATPKAVIKTGSQNPYTAAEGDGNQAFMNSITNLTVDTGTGNPGAIAIDYLANNQGSVEDVAIAGTGVSGISMTRRYPGPCLIKNVSITGFTYGINISRSEYSVVFENLTLADQATAGINNAGNVLSIRNINSANSVPAIRSTSPTGSITVINGTFTGGASSVSAIETTSGELYARNVSSSGYQSVIKSKGSVIAGASKAEFVSNAIEGLFANGGSSLSLPMEETPSFHDNNLSNWANVQSYGATATDNGNDSAAIQAAIDSGATTVYFPSVVGGRYAIGSTIIVRGNVRRIVGFNSSLFTLNAGSMFADATNPNPAFRVAGANDVVIEGFRSWMGTASGPGTIWFEHANSRTLTLKHSIFNQKPYSNQPGAGKLFLEDICAGPWLFSNAQSIWARQLNPENSGLRVQNNGGQLWLLGLKIERTGTVLETKGGGKTELLGGLLYPVTAVPADQPAFVNLESSQSLIYASTAYGSTANDYTVHVRETRGGVTSQLLRSEIPARGYGSFMPLYSGFGAPAAPVINDDSSSIVYSGTWTDNNTTAAGSFNNDEHYSRSTAASAQMTFNGTEVQWFGTKGSNRGYADIYLDTVLAATVDLYSANFLPQQILYSRNGLSVGSHTLKVAVKGTKNPNSSDQIVILDGIYLSRSLVTTNDDNPVVAYTGAWIDNNSSAATSINGDEHYSSSTGASAQFTFSSTEIQWLGNRSSNRGFADVYIDSAFAATVDLYSAASMPQQVLFRKVGLATGSHTIKVVVKGTRNPSSSGYVVMVDAFRTL